MLSHSSRGLTLVELVVALTLLSVGLLGVAATTALTTRMIARGHRSGAGAAWSAGQLEKLRGRACTAPAPGEESLLAGATALVRLVWTFRDLPEDGWSVQLIAHTRTGAGRWRSDTLETAGSCRA